MTELEQLLKKSRTLVRRNGRGRRRHHPSNNTPSQKDAKANQAKPSDTTPPTPKMVGGILMQNVANRSTDIAGIGYNPDTKILAVIYKKNAALYHYPSFTLSGYKRLLKAHSIGSALKKLNLTKYTRIQ